MRSCVAALCLFAAAAYGAHAAAPGSVSDIVAAEGCAIGPQTRLRVIEAGHDAAALDALLVQAERDAETVRTGDWIVLPSSLCKISPPHVRSEIRRTDPEVTALTSAIDAYADTDDRGCFIDGPAIMERVQVTRGWSPDKANEEYLRFLAENLRAGELTFYQPTPLRTPPGFQIFSGDCADVPDIEDIRRSQLLRDREFDALIRADAPNVDCEQDRLLSYNFMTLAKERTGDEMSNAWMFLEVQMMVIGAGWHEGTSATQMGSPRPPLCRYK